MSIVSSSDPKTQTDSELDWLSEPDLADPDSDTVRQQQQGLSDFELERELVSNIIASERVLAHAAEHLDPGALDVLAHKTAAKLAIEFFQRYGTLPNRKTLRQRFEATLRDRKDKVAQLVFFDTLDLHGMNPVQYYLDEIGRIAQRYYFSQALQAYTKNDLPKAFELTAKAERAGQADEDFELYSIEELDKLPGLEWQIADHFPKNGTITIFGPSGAGKSFYCVDMACSIAFGVPFLGKHDVIAGRVLYICSEGGYGLKGRIAAWKAKHGISTAGDIVFSTRSHNLQSRGEVDKILRKAIAKLGGIDVVFIDTLSRNFGPGDADKNADMQQYLRMVDSIREKTGAAVVNIHHTGHSDITRERGAKSLRDYSDSSICIAKAKDESRIEVSCKKQKDAEEFKPYLLSKVKSAGSLHLEYLGDKREVENNDPQYKDADEVEKKRAKREAAILEAIPDNPLDTVISAANSVTVSQIVEVTDLPRKAIDSILEELVLGRRIMRGKVKGDRAGKRYWQVSAVVA